MGIAGFELALESLQAWNLDASCRGEVERVEDKQDILFAAEVRQLDLGFKVAVELKIRGLSANFDHGTGWCKESRGRHLAAICEPGRAQKIVI